MYVHLLDRIAAETCLGDFYISKAAPGTDEYVLIRAKTSPTGGRPLRNGLLLSWLKSPKQDSWQPGEDYGPLQAIPFPPGAPNSAAAQTLTPPQFFSLPVREFPVREFP